MALLRVEDMKLCARFYTFVVNKEKNAHTSENVVKSEAIADRYM